MTTFSVLFALTLVFLLLASIRTHMRAFRLAHMSWDELISKVQPVSASGIATAAHDFLQPAQDQFRLEPMRLWELVGGTEGLQRMYANAEVLIALASQAHEWNLNESLVIAERMRCDARALRRAILRLSVGSLPGNIDLRGAFHLQEAASAYYLMRERLLALYLASHAGRYPRLLSVL